MQEFEQIEPAELVVPSFEAIDKGWMLITGVKPDGSWNTMTASWGALGTLWGKPVVIAFIRSSRYTKEFVDAGDRATFSLFEPDDEYRKALTLLGSKSGRDGDKVAESGLTVRTDHELPFFDEAGAVLFGTKLFAQHLDTDGCFTAKGREMDLHDRWYVKNADGDHTMYVYQVDKALIVAEYEEDGDDHADDEAEN
jgi:flavin reductase (DIM6/NTAB) family NADH-FMN oxidoreductase RutF